MPWVEHNACPCGCGWLMLRTNDVAQWEGAMMLDECRNIQQIVQPVPPESRFFALWRRPRVRNEAEPKRHGPQCNDGPCKGDC